MKPAKGIISNMEVVLSLQCDLLDFFKLSLLTLTPHPMNKSNELLVEKKFFFPFNNIFVR